jgi:hypothetical protein
LTDAQKATLTARMKEVLPTERLEFLIGLLQEAVRIRVEAAVREHLAAGLGNR